MTPEAFSRLLRWLDCGVDSQGQRYEEMRRKLIAYFARWKCCAPEDLTDETFNRVTNWLEENNQEYDEEPAKLCFQTARFVRMEYWRRESREGTPNPPPPPDLEKERKQICLENCLQKLPAGDRDLILRYYSAEGKEKIEIHEAMASELGMSANTLRTKAWRIRNKLWDCVKKCMSE